MVAGAGRMVGPRGCLAAGNCADCWGELTEVTKTSSVVKTMSCLPSPSHHHFLFGGIYKLYKPFPGKWDGLFMVLFYLLLKVHGRLIAASQVIRC